MELFGCDAKQAPYMFASVTVAVVVPFNAVFSRLWVPLKRRVRGSAGALKRYEQKKRCDLHRSVDVSRISGQAGKEGRKTGRCKMRRRTVIQQLLKSSAEIMTIAIGILTCLLRWLPSYFPLLAPSAAHIPAYIGVNSLHEGSLEPELSLSQHIPPATILCGTYLPKSSIYPRGWFLGWRSIRHYFVFLSPQLGLPTAQARG